MNIPQGINWILVKKRYFIIRLNSECWNILCLSPSQCLWAKYIAIYEHIQIETSRKWTPPIVNIFLSVPLVFTIGRFYCMWSSSVVELNSTGRVFIHLLSNVVCFQLLRDYQKITRFLKKNKLGKILFHEMFEVVPLIIYTQLHPFHPNYRKFFFYSLLCWMNSWSRLRHDAKSSSLFDSR